MYQIGPRRRSFDGHAAMHGGHGGHGGGGSLDGRADGAPGRRDGDDGPPASPTRAAAKAIRHLAHVEHAISYSRALQSESVALEPRKNHELDGYVHHDAHKPFELPDDTLRRREPHLGHHHHHGYGSGDDVSEYDDDASVGSVEIRLARQGSYVGEEGITMDIELADDDDDDEEKDARGAGGAAPAAAVELAAPHSPPRNPPPRRPPRRSRSAAAAATRARSWRTRTRRQTAQRRRCNRCHFIDPALARGPAAAAGPGGEGRGGAGEICARARPTGAAARASSRLCQHRKNAEQHMPSGLRAVGSCTRIALSVLTQSFAPFSSAARKR